MLLGLIRYLRGYVDFTVRGRYPERFLNITARSGVRVWSVGRRADTITGAMYMSDYLRIRGIARRAGVALHADKKRGLPIFMRRLRGREGVLIGGFAFILTVFVMSQFVWCIDITGLERVSESEMRALLEEHGLHVGAFRPSVDPMSVSNRVMLDDGRIGWMAVNIQGSYASVEIKEQAPAPEVADTSEPCNIKAARDGTIIRINAGEGKTLLKEGSGVVGGQLVVSGVMEDASGGSRLVRAQAEIVAATSYSAGFSVPCRRTVVTPEHDAGERKSLSLLGARLPLSVYAARGGLAAVSDRLDCLSPLKVTMPIGLVTERVTALSETERDVDYNSAKEILTTQARLYELFALSSCRVTDCVTEIARTDDYYSLKAKYACVEDIAVTSPIGTEG